MGQAYERAQGTQGTEHRAQGTCMDTSDNKADADWHGIGTDDNQPGASIIPEFQVIISAVFPLLQPALIGELAFSLGTCIYRHTCTS